MERDRDNFLQRLDEGQKVYRAIGDCAPAWGMVGTIIGMVTDVRQHVRPLEARPGHGDGAAGHALRRADRQHGLPAHRRQAAREARGRGHLALASSSTASCRSATPRARRSCARCCSPTCPTTTAPKWPKRPDRERTPWHAKRAAAHGGHGWFVTFADLMALLMSFFVMLAAYSTPGPEEAADRRRLDARRLRHASANRRYAGIVESDGIPDTSAPEEFRQAPPEEGPDFTAPEPVQPSRTMACRSRPSIAASRLPRRRCARPCRTCPRSRSYRRISSSRRPRTA